MVEVIIRDGNRIVSWDFHEDDTVLDALKRFKFAWEPDSARVCGMPIPDDLLTEKIVQFVLVATRCNCYTGKLYVDVQQPKKKKKGVMRT